MTIDHRKVVALATNETPFVKRVDDIDDYQVTTTVTRYTKSVWLTDRFKAAALDLNFAYNKSLTDSITGNDLVTFSRASSGTYVGADGLIKTTPVNLLKYSNTFTNSNWTKSGLTLVSSTATAPDGTATATTFSATTGFIFQNGGSVIGQPYVNCIWIKGNANATIGLRRPGNSDSIIGNGSVALNVTTEWQKFTAVQASANNTEGRLLIDLRSSSGATVPAGFEISLWHAQTQEGTTATEYIPTGATISGAPRFDHNPSTGESLGLLIEEARTNILLKSEKLDAWFRGSNSSVTANQAVAPDGTTTADRVQHNSAGSSWLRQNVLTSGVTYTVSVYAKAVTPGTNDQFSFELGFTSPIFTATGEWQRFTFTGTAIGSSVYLNNANDSFATDVYFWGAQVEEGSFATSYIPTDSSTVTRAADVVEITGTNFSSFYNQNVGTIFVDNSYRGLDSFPFVVDYSDGTVNNRHSLFYLTSSNPITLRARTRVSTDQSALEVAIPASGVFAKTAYAYASNNFAVSSAGSSVLTDSTGSIPTINQLTIGATFANASVYSGHMKRIAYFPTRLPNATLQSITS